jgi:hypothetical protein
MIAMLSLAVLVGLVWGREEITELLAAAIARFSK